MEFYLAASESAFRWQNLVVFQIQLSHDQQATPLTRDYIVRGEDCLLSLRERRSHAARGSIRGRPRAEIRAESTETGEARRNLYRVPSACGKVKDSGPKAWDESEQRPSAAKQPNPPGFRKQDGRFGTMNDAVRKLSQAGRENAELHHREAPNNIEAEQALLTAPSSSTTTPITASRTS